MPTQIAPGVFILDTVSTQAYSQSRAAQYVGQFTNHRYQNWQTALAAAELEYKTEYDAYTSNAKAVADSIAAIDKQIEDATDELAKMREDWRDNADTVERGYTNNKQSAANAVTAARNAANRTEYVTESKAPSAATFTPVGMKSEDVSTAVEGSYSSNASIRDMLNNTESALNRSGPGGGNVTAEARPMVDAAVVRRKMADGYTFDQIRESVGNDKETLARLDATINYLSPSTTADGAGPAVVGGRAYKADNTETQAERKADEAEKKAEIEKLRKERLELLLSKPTAPRGDLVGRAQDIYGERFEALPNYKKRKQLETTALAINTYIKRRLLAELPADATDEEIQKARTQALKDAMLIVSGKTPAENSILTALGRDTSTSKTSEDKPNDISNDEIDLTQPITDGSKEPDTEAKLVDLWMPDGSKVQYNTVTKEYTGVDKSGKPFTYKEGSPEAKLIEENASGEEPGDPSAGRQVVIKDGDYTWIWTEGTDSYQVASGPANVGKVFGKGTKAYDILTPLKDKAIAETPKPKTPQEKIIEKGKANEVDPSFFDLKDPTIDKAAIRRRILEMAGVSPDLLGAIEDLPKGSAPASTSSAQPPVPQQPSIPQLPEKQQNLLKEIAGGIKLRSQDRKLKRLGENTSYGKWVDELYTANSKLENPKSAAQLREDVLAQYKDNEEEAREATRYMFAKFLRDSNTLK